MLNRNADQHDKILQAILSKYPSDGVGNGDFKKILTSWYSRIRKNGDIKPYLLKLGEASGVLEGIRDACWANWLPPENSKYVPQTLWAWPNDDALAHRPKGWLESSPADLDDIDNYMADYLKRPWMRRDAIDASVINALIFTELALYADEVKSGRPFGMINWSYLFSRGNPLKQLGFSLIGSAGVTIGIWALYLTYRLFTIPARFRLRKARKRAAEKAVETLTAMETAWHAARGQIINPSRLRELVLAAEERGAKFRPLPAYPP